MIKVSCQIIQTPQILSKSKEHGSQWDSGLKQVVSPDVLFARSRFARTESRFAWSMKSFRPIFFSTGLRIKRIKSSSRFFSDRSNDESNTNKQAKKVCEYSLF